MCNGQRDTSDNGVTILSLERSCLMLTLDTTVKHSVSNQLDHYKFGINYLRVQILEVHFKFFSGSLLGYTVTSQNLEN